MLPQTSSTTPTTARRRGVVGYFLVAFAVLLLSFTNGAQAAGAPLITWDALNPEINTTPAPAAHGTVPATTEDASISHTFDPSTTETRVPIDWTAPGYAVSNAVIDRQVLIDGYVLPLAWKGARVVDFLLVPWVGACIHMPTPAANQIVRVSVPDGIVLERQFEAVRLEGTLKHAQIEQDLFLVDGQRSVPVSYALEGAAISGSPGKVIAMSASDLPILAKLQLKINALFTSSMQAIADEASSKALFFALFISFGYGALHTLGPGHGKSVVISYFIGSGGSLRRGVAMGTQIAVMHVFSAIAVVFLLDLAVRSLTGAAPSDFRAIRLGSYSLIVVIGSIMLWQAVSAYLARKNAITQDAGSHEHAHHHEHGSHSGCSACAAVEASQKQGRWIAASVGVVPCTGALLVMLFGLANDLVWPAILMVVSISIGMAVSMAAIGIVALYGRSLAKKKLSNRTDQSFNFDVGARLIGSACVLIIGIALFTTTLLYPTTIQPPLSDRSETRADVIPLKG